MRITPLLFLVSLCPILADFPAKAAAIQIKVGAPIVTYETFPAGHPPLHAKGLEQGEAGLCHTEIACQVGVEGEVPRTALGEVNPILSSCSFNISARITIWCQEGYTPTIIDHEEAHRAISEHYYAMARKVAQQLADKAVTRKLTLVGKPAAEALSRALKRMQTELLDEFVRQISQRSEYAQDRFDALTDHGRNAVVNSVAINQAMREEEEHWEKIEQTRLKNE